MLGCYGKIYDADTTDKDLWGVDGDSSMKMTPDGNVRLFMGVENVKGPDLQVAWGEPTGYDSESEGTVQVGWLVGWLVGCSEQSDQGSLVSSVTGQENREHCFLAGTRFERLDGSSATCAALQQFDYVRGFELDLQIMWMKVLPESMQHDLVFIHAGSVIMTVTANHRVMVRRGDIVPAPADSLRVGDDVVCRSGVQRICPEPICPEPMYPEVICPEPICPVPICPEPK